ncbi:uncharacterized protein LTHEOB_2211 [Neofusicoccum parvum]|uniref:Uncharacterized protein LTHEOB_2211 n=1 Tax=Neofusicoccum parvum TaxID=310453 RepID=A0ACB5SKP1_9PEZI|nr:uncharacterized protein LTHEOB_2211 [Neofusicoccum parvum]
MRIMDSVIYYNDCIAPFIVPDPAVVNWSMIPLDEWRCEPQLIKDIMLMIVSQHKAIRGQRDLDRDLEVCQQRNNTIQALNKQLSNVSTQITDVALDAVMMLLTADIQYSAMGSCIEVMGGTTSNAQLLSQSINWPRGLAENFPDWDAIAVTACFPCPATLFHAISRINDLRASLFRQTSFSALTTTFSSLSLQSPHEDTIDEIRSILKQIKAFSASKWLPAVIKTLDFEFEPTSPDWLALTHCYHAATLLYCLRTLVFESPLRHHDEFDEALSSLLEDLFGTSVGEAVRVGALRALFTHLGCPLSMLAGKGLSAHSSAWNAVMWPLFISGYEAGGDGLGAEEMRGMREFVVGKTKELAMLLGTRSVVDAQVILEKCWERREKGGGEGLDGGWTWDETFTKRCVFII